MTRTTPRLVAALLVALLLGGACGGGGDDDDTTTTTAEARTASTSTTVASGTGTTGEDSTTTTEATTGVIALTIAGGNVQGGVQREKVAVGSPVTLRVTSDVADEIHVHGYDLKLDLVAGQTKELTFEAKIPGVFEVELEHRGKKVLELEVA